MLHRELSSKIIGSFYNVYNKLGFGFLEKVYENSLLHELREQGLKCSQQEPIEVFYKNFKAGLYFADIIVEDKMILEVKCVETLMEAHELQLINYLKATDIEIGLLLNFGKEPQFSRKVFSNNRAIIRKIRVLSLLIQKNLSTLEQ
ncbi:MAG: GxxExxY protein [Bacteroidetes bacterium]|nr:GxxExxY protein [Bacteroidota bacterium]